MILNRYFLKTIFSYTVAISVIFILIIVSSRTIQYLEQASRGEINAEIVFSIVLFRLPEFLELILPLSFFLSIVLTMGKFKSESEYVIMEQSGFSIFRVYSLLLVPALLIAMLLFSFSQFINPSLDLKIKNLLEVKSEEDRLKALSPGEFHKLGESYLIYAKEKKDNGLKDIFLIVKDSKDQSNSVLVAKDFNLLDSDRRDLNFSNGFSYILEEPDELFSLEFENLIIKNNLTSNKIDNENFKEIDLTSSLIWSSSISLLTLLSVFIALPMSERKPRNGRYSRVLPSLLIFSLYIGLLLSFKGSEVESLNSILLVHLIFLAISLFLNLRTYKAIR